MQPQSTELGFRRQLFNQPSSYIDGVAGSTAVTNAEASVAGMSETATMEFLHTMDTEALSQRGERLLRALYFLGHSKSQGRKVYEDLMGTSSLFCEEASSHITYVAAGTVARDATSVLCSTQLFRSLARLLDILHKLDCLRSLMYKMLDPDVARFSLPSPFAVIQEPVDRLEANQGASSSTAGPSRAETDDEEEAQVNEEEPGPDSSPAKGLSRKLSRAKSLWKKVVLKAKKNEKEDPEFTSSPRIRTAPDVAHKDTESDSVATPSHLRDFHPGLPDTPTSESKPDIEASDEWISFLSDPWTAVHGLSQHLKGVPYASVFLAQACRFYLRVISKKENSTIAFQEVQAMASALSAALVLLHHCADAKEGKLNNLLGARKILKCIRVLRQFAVLPLFADQPLCVMDLLMACPTISIQSELSGSDWGLLTMTQLLAKDPLSLDKQYKLVEQTNAARTAHDTFLQAFLIYTLQVGELSDEEKNSNVAVVTTGLHLWLTCFALLSQWRQQCLTYLAWSRVRRNANSVLLSLRDERLEALLQLMSMMKGLGDVMAEAAPWMQQQVNAAACAHMQHIVHTLLPSWAKSSSSSKVTKSFTQLQKALQYWPQIPTMSGDQTPRGRGFKAMLRASVLKIQSTASSSNSDPQTPRSSQRGSMLSGDLSAAVNALQVAVERMLPDIIQSPLGTPQATIQTVAPSDVQIFQLVQGLEEALKEDPTGKWKGVTPGGWSASKKREVEAVLVMTHQWFGNLDIFRNTQVVCQLGEVVLGECVREVLPADSLSLLLSTACLESQAGGPAESALLPLALFNDASHILHKEHQSPLLPVLTGQANACLDLLLNRMAQEVFKHYKAHAALNLTDARIAGQCNSLSPLIVYREFTRLLQIPILPLLDRNVELSRSLAERLTVLLKDNTAHLIQSYESNHASALCELEALLYTVENAHALLSKHTRLPTWLEILTEADNANSFSLITSRVAVHTAKDVIQDLLPFCKLDQILSRFTPGPKARLPAPLSRHSQESFMWGPGGSERSVLSNWTELHLGFFGNPHLEALAHIAGKGGTALLVESLKNHMIQLCEAQIFPGICELLPRMKGLKRDLERPSQGNFKADLQLYTSVLPQVFTDELQKQILLRNFTELGNAIALLTMLDQVLGVSQDQAFLLAAEHLGIASDDPEHLSILVDDESRTAGPLQKAAHQIDFVDENKAPEEKPGVPRAAIGHHVHEAFTTAWEETKASSILPGVFSSLKAAISGMSFNQGSPELSTQSILSTVIFNTCLWKPVGESLTNLPKPRRSKATSKLTSDWLERGDGPIVGAIALATLLDQEGDLLLQDFTLRSLKTSQFHTLTDVTAEEQAFLKSAQRLKGLVQSTVAMIQGALPGKPPPSVIVAGKSAANPAIIPAEPLPFAAPPLENQAYQARLEAPQASFSASASHAQPYRRPSALHPAVAADYDQEGEYAQERSPLSEAVHVETYFQNTEGVQTHLQEQARADWQGNRWGSFQEGVTNWPYMVPTKPVAGNEVRAGSDPTMEGAQAGPDSQYLEGLATWQAKSYRDSFSESQQRPTVDQTPLYWAGSESSLVYPSPRAQMGRHSFASELPSSTQHHREPQHPRTRGILTEALSRHDSEDAPPEGLHWLERTGTVQEAELEQELERMSVERQSQENSRLPSRSASFDKENTDLSSFAGASREQRALQENQSLRVLNAQNAPPDSVFQHTRERSDTPTDSSQPVPSAQEATSQDPREDPHDSAAPGVGTPPGDSQEGTPEPAERIPERGSALSNESALQGKATIEYTSTAGGFIPPSSVSPTTGSHSAHTTRPGSAETCTPDKAQQPGQAPLPETSLLAQLRNLQTIEELRFEKEPPETDRSPRRSSLGGHVSDEESMIQSALEAEEQASEGAAGSEPPTRRLDELPEAEQASMRVSEGVRSEDLESAQGGRRGMSERSASLHSALGRHSNPGHALLGDDSDLPSVMDTESEEASPIRSHPLHHLPQAELTPSPAKAHLGPPKGAPPMTVRRASTSDEEALIAASPQHASHEAGDNATAKESSEEDTASTAATEDKSDPSETQDMTLHSQGKPAPSGKAGRTSQSQPAAGQLGESLDQTGPVQTGEAVPKLSIPNSLASLSDTSPESGTRTSDTGPSGPTSASSETAPPEVSRRSSVSTEREAPPRVREAAVQQAIADSSARISNTGSEASTKSKASQESKGLSGWATELGGIIDRLSSKKEGSGDEDPGAAFNLGAYFS